MQNTSKQYDEAIAQCRELAINNKVGMRKYRVTPSNGGYYISN